MAQSNSVRWLSSGGVLTDWGVKNLENAIKDYEKSGPVKAEYSGLHVSKPTKEMVENIMRYKKIESN